jgi:hypothetical protein
MWKSGETRQRRVGRRGSPCVGQGVNINSMSRSNRTLVLLGSLSAVTTGHMLISLFTTDGNIRNVGQTLRKGLDLLPLIPWCRETSPGNHLKNTGIVEEIFIFVAIL